ncbi:unnamed protein product [Mytilus edulis]|uniref:Uncharacterized protein n=1 Tax=Mytilus edulis TaxID=6550 RepID=A0A8S3TLQ2_MYTED|nr:unnamed protein product [Mytilus edulis]
MSSQEIAVDLMSEERLENAIRSNDLTLLKNLLSQGVEKNHQDNNGKLNIVFHNAIRTCRTCRMDAHMYILKELLLNGSDVNIVNKKHLLSISFAFLYGSDDIIIKLFALDHIHLVNYDDRNGNSFLHLLPKRSNLTEIFMESLKDFQLNINTTNKFSDTPIHIVCKVIGRLEKKHLHQMKLFLNTFDGFDPFICNNGGDTFLHSCFDSIQMDDNDVDFINCLTGGGFR